MCLPIRPLALLALSTLSPELPAETVRLPDASVYEGSLEDGLFHGRGVLEWANGDRYVGQFAAGLMAGEGVLREAGGATYTGTFRGGQIVSGRWEDGGGQRYEGGFADWLFAGEGRFFTDLGERYSGRFENGSIVEGLYVGADGSRYQGAFQDWAPHGTGRWTGPDGRVRSGRFEYGEYRGPSSLAGSVGAAAGELLAAWRAPGAAPGALLAERALYAQPALLDAALAGLAPQRPGKLDLYALHVAGDGSQEVFRREIEYAGALFTGELGLAGRVLTLANSRSSVERLPMATRESIRRGLAALAAAMDPEEDLLFLYLSSHGSPDHALILDQNGMELPDLGAAELGAWLRELPVAHKVVVVSACFSGGFIPFLADGRTTVITAARPDRPSFGCADENEFTDFGRALLEDNLARAGGLREAFGRAVERIEASEARQGIDPPSAPQLHDERRVTRRFDRWLRRARGR